MTKSIQLRGIEWTLAISKLLEKRGYTLQWTTKRYAVFSKAGKPTWKVCF